MVKEVLIRFRLIGEEAKALCELAGQELRHPRDQVRYILRQELERCGLLALESGEKRCVPVQGRGEGVGG